MFNKIKKILKENYQIDDVKLESNFKKDFDLTSFDYVNLICLIEDEIGIEIDENKYRTINTIGDLVKYLENEVK